MGDLLVREGGFFSVLDFYFGGCSLRKFFLGLVGSRVLYRWVVGKFGFRGIRGCNRRRGGGRRVVVFFVCCLGCG